jgi:hypothetical protein
MKAKWVLATHLDDGCLTAWWCGQKKGWQELPQAAFTFPNKKSAETAIKDVPVPKVLFDLKTSQLQVKPVDLIKLFKGRK